MCETFVRSCFCHWIRAILVGGFVITLRYITQHTVLRVTGLCCLFFVANLGGSFFNRGGFPQQNLISRQISCASAESLHRPTRRSGGTLMSPTSALAARLRALLSRPFMTEKIKSASGENRPGAPARFKGGDISSGKSRGVWLPYKKRG